MAAGHLKRPATVDDEKLRKTNINNTNIHQNNKIDNTKMTLITLAPCIYSITSRLRTLIP